MKKLYRATVDVKSGRDGSIQSTDGKLMAALAFPKDLGGTGEGTNPEQLFAAGHAACFGSSLSHIAKSQGTPLTQVRIEAHVDLILADDGGYDLAVEFDVHAEGQPRQVIEGLIEKAKSVCAYSRATKGRIESKIRYAGN